MFRGVTTSSSVVVRLAFFAVVLAVAVEAFQAPSVDVKTNAILVSHKNTKGSSSFLFHSPPYLPDGGGTNVLFEGQGLPSSKAWTDRLIRITRWAGSKAANRPVISEYKPSGFWLWSRWHGTVLEMIYPFFLLTMAMALGIDLWARHVSKTTWGLLCVPPSTDPFIRSLAGLEKLWTYNSTFCTFMLTFFASQAYTYWQKVYNTSRMIQGRINDFCMLLTMSAEREIRPDTSTVIHENTINGIKANGIKARDDDTRIASTTQYTSRALRLVQKCTRLIRMTHTLFWAATPTASNGLTDSEEFLERDDDRPIAVDESIGPLLLSPYGLKALVNTGQLTKAEAEGLMKIGLFPSQYAYVLLEWVGMHCMEGLQSGMLVGGPGLENSLLKQLTMLRASLFDIDDFRAGRMPLAYVQLVQLLVDSLVILAPFSLYPQLGSLTIPLVGLLTMFFRGLMALSKSFLDPFGVEGYEEQNIRVDVLVSELNFGASKRWIQAGSLLPIDKALLADSLVTSTSTK